MGLEGEGRKKTKTAQPVMHGYRRVWDEIVNTGWK